MHGYFKQADVPLEVLLLVVAGLTMAVTGVLLVPASTGAFTPNEDGLHGLMLVVFALQITTLGKTPFGDARRTPLLVALGALAAAVGILSCFVPDLLGEIPRVLLVVCFGGGGLVLLVRVLVDEQKARTWWRAGGALRQLAWSSCAVYLLSVLVAFVLWWPAWLPLATTAVVALVFGVAILYLAVVLRTVYRSYPEAEHPFNDDPALSTDHALLLLLGIFMVLLGVVLVPVSLGTLPFSGSAQLGLMMVIFAVQMLASGSTPIGAFPRSWPMIGLGLAFAVLGIVSTLVPGVLVVTLTLLIGGLNVVSGVITLGKTLAPLASRSTKRRDPVPPVLVRLGVVQVLMGLLALLFGASMLVSQLITGPVLGVILTANGCVLLVELWILVQIDRMQAHQPAAA